MRSHPVHLLPVLLAAYFVVPCARRAPADESPATRAPVYDAKRTAAERVENEAAYRELMTHFRERLLHQHVGRWVVIAGGKALPLNEYGTRVEPAETMEAALAAATFQVPAAQHRFVFRIGEDGDVDTSLGGTGLAHVFGMGFMGLLRGGLTFMPDGTVTFERRDGTSVKISTDGPEHRSYVQPEIGPPSGPGFAEPLFVLATGCSGYGTVPADTAARAGLHLWEIPGVNRVDGALSKGTCRRARMRVRLPVAQLDVLLPVAIWAPN